MDNTKKKDFKKIWVDKIETEENATMVVKDVSYGLFFVAGLLVIVAFLLKTAGIIDGLLFAILAFLLLRFKSRIAAISLLLLSIASVIVTFMNKISSTNRGGTNIFLAVVILWSSIRAIQATLVLAKVKRLTGKQ